MFFVCGRSETRQRREDCIPYAELAPAGEAHEDRVTCRIAWARRATRASAQNHRMRRLFVACPGRLDPVRPDPLLRVRQPRLNAASARTLNVWPAPSARGNSHLCSGQSASTYPVSGLVPGQDGDPRGLILIIRAASKWAVQGVRFSSRRSTVRPSSFYLTQTSLTLRREGTPISRLPEVEGDQGKKQKFATYPIGYFHIDIAEVQTQDGKLDMLWPWIAPQSFAYAELHPRATRIIAKAFLDKPT
jgi:hypothetical protein